MRVLHSWRAAAVIAGLALLVACGDDDAPLSSLSPTAPSASPAVTPALTTSMNEALQDEYTAGAIYKRVLADLGATLLPFANIVNAEAQHAASIAQLFVTRGLTAPAPMATVESVPGYPTVQAACAAAADAERLNIALYDRLLAADLPNDVRLVFENNRLASVRNHLPAFELCR